MVNTYKVKLTPLQQSIIRILSVKNTQGLNQRTIAKLLEVTPPAVAKALPTLKKEKLILDWKKKERAKAAVRQCIEIELDKLPDVYTDDIWKSKCDGTYGYVLERM